jgi:hypothetical protein
MASAVAKWREVLESLRSLHGLWFSGSDWLCRTIALVVKVAEKDLNDGQRFALAMTQVAGKRVTYSDLTGKDESPRYEATGTWETTTISFLVLVGTFRFAQRSSRSLLLLLFSGFRLWKPEKARPCRARTSLSLPGLLFIRPYLSS